MERDDQHRADALDRYWDASLARGAPGQPVEVDAFTAAVVAHLDQQDVPADPALRERTRQRVLAHSTAMEASMITHPPSHAAPLPDRSGTVPAPWWGRARWGAIQLVTGALLVLTILTGLVGSGIWRPSGPQSPLLQLAAISTPSMVGTPAPVSPVAFEWQTTGGPNLPLTGAGLLALDPQGNLWVPDSSANRFQLFAPDGTFLDAWGTAGHGESQFTFVAAGIGFGAAAFDADGNLYVADTGNYRIQKFDPTRRFLTEWGSQGAKDGQFLRPLSVAVDEQGRVFVGDDLRGDIQVFDRDGEYLATWGGKDAGKGRLNSPGGITFDSDGNVWVADINSNRILEFSSEGEFLVAWGSYGSEPGELFSPQSLAVDAQGRVYVAEFGNYRVQVFESQGQLLSPDSLGQPLTTWGESWRGDGQFDGVYGLVLDGKGNIYTSEGLNPRVQKFRLLPPLAP